MTINSSNTVQTNTTLNSKSKSQYTDTVDVVSATNNIEQSNSEYISNSDKTFNLLFGGSEEMMNDRNLRNSFNNYYSNMGEAKFTFLMMPEYTMEVSKDNLPSLEREQQRTNDIQKLFSSKENVIEYYSNKINESLESKFDTSFMRKIHSDYMKIFQDSLQREQEDSYLQLGKRVTYDNK